ncbi:hypothetical protein O6H91_14G073800 [Diphasiastrum complanatum]|uniref:Uncharacterized protein n=2 Tax=Diphasiastrum complanatum TaxID=34168 RepID=A0ACC2BRT2_DIPCM|nr:hypothetical protein O6H91_14G049700 [Diphasiastrum complanatum]KAJ7532142.1 hypothetical protein O6H91_14G073800 [Diphasiastrum complanatum]
MEGGGITGTGIVSAATFLFAFAFAFAFFSRHPLYGRNRGCVVYPLLGNFISFFRNRDRFLDWNTELMQKDASQTIRNALPGGMEFHVTANPDNIEHILRTKFENYPKGVYYQSVMEDLLGKGIFNVDGEHWKIQRKVASHEFTTRSLRDFTVESVAREVKRRLLPTLEHFCQSRVCFDLQELLMRFSFDNICQIAFRVDPACLHFSLPAVEFAEAFDEATGIVAERFMSIHPLFWKIMRALDIGSERRLREALQVVDKFAMNVIRSRRKEIEDRKAKGECGKDHSDLLSRFMSIEEDLLDYQELPDRDEFLKDVVISFLLAGKDTTATALSWFFWALSAHPHVEQSCYDEMQSLLDGRSASQSVNASTEDHTQENKEHERSNAQQGSCVTFFAYDELKQMNYLQAAISESLRLYPPVPIDIKFAMQDDVWPDGTVIRKNTNVMYHPYGVGRMESVWGKDCLQFKPERWVKEGICVPENPYKFPAFQAGPRICLGKEMAMIQMKYVAATIIYNFRIKLAVPDFKPKYAISLVMRMIGGLSVNVSNRQSQQARC